MKVNSFFCGAGGFDLGFIQAGFEIAGAWDFDKYAVESYKHNIGKHVLQADVSSMKGEQLPKANGWLFGFPCQDISIAGKQKGMVKGETRSGLFYEIMRLLGEVSDKPEWILAENVKAVKKLIPVIEQEYDKAGYTLVSPQLYNTKFEFLPQNRERFFLMGLRKDLAKSFVFPQQQTDFIPKLSSVLEENVDEKYYIDDLKAAKIIEQAIEGLRVKQATKKGYDIAVEGDSINISHPNSKTRRGRVGKQVAQTLLTGQEQVVVETTGCSLRTRTYAGQPQQLEVRKDGISNSVTTVPKDCMVMESLHGITANEPHGWNTGNQYPNDYTGTVTSRDYKGPRMVIEEQPKILCVGNTNPSGNGMNGKVYAIEGIAPTVTTNKGEGHKILECYRVRKLTPREYARLQGFPDSYEQIVSNSQFYKQMGNAVSVPVAYKIAKAIKEQL
jgi:DNA (cytosine-5)-methyltransferase 1